MLFLILGFWKKKKKEKSEIPLSMPVNRPGFHTDNAVCPEQVWADFAHHGS